MNDGLPESTISSSRFDTVWDRLWAPCDVASVAFFRAGFALIVLWHIGLYFSANSIEYYFGRAPHHLSYFGFEWVRAFELDGMRRVYYLMAFAAVGVGLGLCYRVSAVLLFITFTYTFLAEAAQFQNHYYMMCLVAFLLVVIPAHRSFSIDSILVPDKASGVIPNWCRWLLIFQIAIPYIYGGIAKLNGDWLHGMPVGLWVSEKSHLPLIGPLLTERSTAWFISYTGVIFDLSIVPLLLWPRTRKWAFAIVVVFHLSNTVLFDIDVFPWMMILATTILFSPDWPRRLLRLDESAVESTADSSAPNQSFCRQLLVGLVSIYVLWQVSFPFRYFLYPGNPSWTEEGQQFAWRMMLRRKDVFCRIYATDGPSRRVAEVPLDRLMSFRQLHELATSPSQLVACAPFFADRAHGIGFRDVEVRAIVLTSLNGRKPQLQIDPELNLLTLARSIRPQPGILPQTEPRREDAWDVPIDDWPKELGITLPTTQPTLP